VKKRKGLLRRRDSRDENPQAAAPNPPVPGGANSHSIHAAVEHSIRSGSNSYIGYD
jgi:hypothetical protein